MPLLEETEMRCENCNDDIYGDEYTECDKCGAILCPDCVCEECENGYQTTARSEGGY
jgi:hypothetical protein